MVRVRQQYQHFFCPAPLMSASVESASPPRAARRRPLLSQGAGDTSFIERLDLTVRHCCAYVGRRRLSHARGDEHLL